MPVANGRVFTNARWCSRSHHSSFRYDLPGRGADGPLVAGEGLGGAGGDGDVADEVDAGGAAGEVFAALVEAGVGGDVAWVDGAVHLGGAVSLGLVVGLLGQHALDGDLGGFEVHGDGDGADDVGGVDEERGEEVDADRGHRPLLHPGGGVAPGGAGGGLAGLGLEEGGLHGVQLGRPGVALGHRLDVVDGVVRVVHGVDEGGQAALAERLADADVGLLEAGADVGQLAGHDDGEAGVAVELAPCGRAARAMAWASAASSRV